jgi:hypothetical protein
MGSVVSVTPRPRFTPRESTPGTRWLAAGLDTALINVYCVLRLASKKYIGTSKSLFRALIVTHLGSVTPWLCS